LDSTGHGNRAHRLHGLFFEHRLESQAAVTDFQTPPLAEPTKTVNRPSSVMASIAATRPLIIAEPMLRTGKPEMWRNQTSQTVERLIRMERNGGEGDQNYAGEIAPMERIHSRLRRFRS